MVGSTSHQARRLPSAGLRSRTLWLTSSTIRAPISRISHSTGASSTMSRHSTSTGRQARITRTTLPSRLATQAVSQARGMPRAVRVQKALPAPSPMTRKFSKQ